MRKTVYVIRDLGIELQTPDAVDWMRPKWVVTLGLKELKHQFSPDPTKKPIERKCPIGGSFVIERIEHVISAAGDVQRVYLRPKDWVCKWTNSEPSH